MSMERLLGSWELTMHHSQLSEPVLGRQRYELVLGDAFVELHWEYDHPDFPDAVAIFDEHRYHYFDVRGVVRVFDFELEDSGWTMTWIDPGFSQRSTATFRGDDAIDIYGERSTDGGQTWQHDFTMLLTRVGSTSQPVP